MRSTFSFLTLSTATAAGLAIEIRICTVGVAAMDLLNREDVKQTGNKVGYFKILPVSAIVLDVCNAASIKQAVAHFATKQKEHGKTQEATGNSANGEIGGSSSAGKGTGTAAGGKKGAKAAAGSNGKPSKLSSEWEDTGRLDVLINNAGVLVPEEKPGAAPITVATNATALATVSNVSVRSKQTKHRLIVSGLVCYPLFLSSLPLFSSSLLFLSQPFHPFRLGPNPPYFL